MKIALCGNPNVGKTTLFNRITRSDAPVGNWHGVTVDVKSKRVGKDVVLSDLPGAYSLTARTAEECVTRDCILYGDYDVFVYVAEANNIRRNLYMFTQMIEAGKRVVLVINMMDEARGKIDLDLLSKRLGVPVIGTSFKYKNPKNDILSAADKALVGIPQPPPYLKSRTVRALADGLGKKSVALALPPEFVALKTIEGDTDIIERIGGKVCVGSENGICSDCTSCFEMRDRPAVMRYGYIDAVLDGAREKPKADILTNKIDGVLLGKFALPIFLAVMAAVFVITFEAGRPLSAALVALSEKLSAPIGNTGLPDWAVSLMTDGIISGVGGVLAFLPQVVILYLLTAVLQDSGYMSRVAFVTDDFFKRFGLGGRAAFSLVLGLGCSASAILTTRGIADKNARKRTAFITSFCPCSARLAVFTAVTAYFGLSGIVVAAMYVSGFAAALIVLKIMKAFGRDNGSENMIMEMPPYRMPSVKRVMNTVFRNVLSFICRVGSTVLAVSVIFWILCNFSIAHGFSGGGEESIMNTLASLLAPAFAPLGFGSWKAVTALLSGIAAKETVISVIAALGGMGEVFGSATAAVSFMIFTCLYVPCAATLSVIAKENGIRSAALSVAVHTVAAYGASLVYYQSALLFERSLTAFVAVYAVAAAVAAIAVSARIVIGKKKQKNAMHSRGVPL